MIKNITFDTTQFDFDLINHVKKLRGDKKWSQDELSLKIGVAKSFVSNVERFAANLSFTVFSTMPLGYNPT